ncbi:hypothetical protein [Ferrimonas senticii]|nr:hypothetical protein [Ferrimonas senticii]
MQQRSHRRRQIHLKVHHKRRVRRNLFFVTEQREQGPVARGAS